MSAPRLRLPVAVVSLVVAAAIWLPSIHLLFRPSAGEYRTTSGDPGPRTAALVQRQASLWRDPELRARELDRMRRTNAEWDLMARTFLVLAMANLAERQPERRREWLDAADAILADTLSLERRLGHPHFLMDYARHEPFVAPSGRSLFVDGEIAMMLAARQLVARDPALDAFLAERVDLVVGSMRSGPVLSGESYPDECWIFCNAMAAAAVRLADAATGSDHGDFLAAWAETARRQLVDPVTGLLVSRYTYDGDVIEGPEGTCLFLVAHCLQLVDPPFARDQYRRARQALGRSFLGFGYAREWPDVREGASDVDSGPILPILEASAGSSGLAVLGAAAFDDDQFLGRLLTSLEAMGFPIDEDGELRFAASNAVGDAVILYALVQGPLWKKAMAR